MRVLVTGREGSGKTTLISVLSSTDYPGSNKTSFFECRIDDIHLVDGACDVLLWVVNFSNTLIEDREQSTITSYLRKHDGVRLVMAATFASPDVESLPNYDDEKSDEINWSNNLKVWEGNVSSLFRLHVPIVIVPVDNRTGKRTTLLGDWINQLLSSIHSRTIKATQSVVKSFLRKFYYKYKHVILWIGCVAVIGFVVFVFVETQSTSETEVSTTNHP